MWKRQLALMPGGSPQKSSQLDKEALRIFSLAARVRYGGDGLPSEGEEPITPKEALLISYVSTPMCWESLGFDSSGKRLPGFLSVATNVAILSILPDGLRPGAFMISKVFPTSQDEDKVLMTSMLVFDTIRFGPQSVISFTHRFPNIPIAVLLTEILFDDAAEG